MTVYFAAALMLMAITSIGPVGLSPDTMYELGLRAERPPPCRVPSPAERHAAGEYPQGKAATYSFDGFYLCEKEIFAYADRSPFANFLARHAGEQARVVARQIADQYERPAGTGDARQWYVYVELDDEQLRPYVESVFTTHLAEALVQDKVTRLRLDPNHRPALLVRVNRVADPDSLFETYIAAPNPQGGVRWLAL